MNTQNVAEVTILCVSFLNKLALMESLSLVTSIHSL